MKKYIKTYKKWDKLPWIMPMIVWEEITIFEKDNISIQFFCYKKHNNYYVYISNLESSNPWSWNFDRVLWDFCKYFEKATEIQIWDVINSWIIKYLMKHNIKIYDSIEIL